MSQSQTYYFDIEKCKVCPMRDGCYKEGAKSKTYSVTIKSDTHAEQEAFQNTEAFKQLAANRYKVEAKNSETMFAVNLKRILKLLNENK